jgi:hypothetical protein
LLLLKKILEMQGSLMSIGEYGHSCQFAFCLSPANLEDTLRATARWSQPVLAGESEPSCEPELDEVVWAAALRSAGVISSGSMGLWRSGCFTNEWAETGSYPALRDQQGGRRRNFDDYSAGFRSHAFESCDRIECEGGDAVLVQLVCSRKRCTSADGGAYRRLLAIRPAPDVSS